MKQSVILINLIITSICITPSCSSFNDCQDVTNRHLSILIDVSDKKLFNEIEDDIKENFPVFMQHTRLGEISPCESFTLSFADLGGKETLDISSKTIAINKRGLSGEEERNLSNPAPLVELMRKKLDNYRQLTNEPELTSSTNIANVLLKTINQSKPVDENILLVFSDGVENNHHLNLYNGMPVVNDFSRVIEEIIEPSVLRKFGQLQQQGLQTKVIMVLKSEPAGKVDNRAIKLFWTKVFDELGLQYQFIDNLSNEVEL